MSSEGPRAWKTISSEPGPDLHLFRVRHDTVEHPHTGAAFQRVVLESPDWVNAVVRTPEGQLVFVRQFRFGIGAVDLEVPGGIVDEGETPEEAARRELREESGYTAERWTYLGSVHGNPAFMNNACHHFLAEGAVRSEELDPDAGEDLSLELLDPDRVRELVRDGSIRHPMAISALARVLPQLFDPQT